jgi:REP element-mobilizing transposase RayT
VSHFIYVHVVWGTRGDLPLVDATRAMLLHRHLRTVGRQERCRVIAIGLTATQVHLLVRLHPTTFLPRLLHRLKAGGARCVNREAPAGGATELRWAPGCLIHSVSSATVDAVSDYVRGQATHRPGRRVIGVA